MSATIKDIAKITGLGIATVSKYLNGGNVRPKNKIAIEKAIKDLHYTVNSFARSLKTSKSNTIGIVIPELSNAFITTIISTVEDILRKSGYATFVCDCRSDEKMEADVVNFLLSKQVDGIINMPLTANGNHLLPAISNNIPIVLIDRMIKELVGKVSAVIVDNTDATEKATEYLIKSGFTNIAMILGPKDIYTTLLRYKGFINTLNKYNIELNPNNIIYSDYNISGGYESTKELFKLKKPPEAIFVTNYEMTLGSIVALNEMHVNIPEDISIVGFDRPDLFSAIYPDLTAIRQPQNRIGEVAARLILNNLSSDKSQRYNQVITLPTELQLGSSIKIKKA